MYALNAGYERLTELGLEHAAAVLKDTLQAAVKEKMTILLPFQSFRTMNVLKGKGGTWRCA